MNIGLTYDLQTDTTDERQAEFDSPATLEALQDALESLGHRVVRLGNAQQLLADRAQLDWVDLVFNIAEGRGTRCREAWVPALLEHWGIPFVGSGTVTQALALDKVMTKRLAYASEIPTPRWISAEVPLTLAQLSHLSFPLIVKPRYEGSGLGIDRHAVVQDLSSLNRRIEWALARFQQPCVVEEFIPFGELTVLLIGNHPPRALPVIQRPLDPDSRLSCHVARSSAQHWLSPVDLTPALEAAARALAVATFETLGCRDVARVDLRVDEQGGLYLLELNPLPSLDPEGSVGLLAECLGISYAALIGEILEASLQRIGTSSNLLCQKVSRQRVTRPPRLLQPAGRGSRGPHAGPQASGGWGANVSHAMEPPPPRGLPRLAGEMASDREPEGGRSGRTAVGWRSGRTRCRNNSTA